MQQVHLGGPGGARQVPRPRQQCLDGLFVVRGLSTGTHPAQDLPFQAIYERIDTLPGITLEELVAHEFVSAVKVRLAVAVLARAAVIEAVITGNGSANGGVPPT